MAARASVPAKTPAVTVRVTEAAPYLELLDPERITVRNIREARPSKQLVDSVREHGLLQPIGVLRVPGGELVLRFGGRRRLACIEAGRQALAIVIDGTSGTSETEIERIFTQLDENDNREDLTAAERAGAVAELFEYGADERTVTRRTGLGRAEIAAARLVAASKTAQTLAAQYPVDLAQAAVIAEFDDDQETAEELARAARDEPAQFEHLAEQAREDRTEAVLIAARTAELAAEGITVTDKYLSHEYRIEYLNGPDGRQLTPETHKGCPGAVVLLRIAGYDDNRKVEETGYCTDPKANGHKKRRGLDQPDASPEEATAERRKVIENNKAWRAATAVRERWIRDVLIARKTLPEGAAMLIARTIAAADYHMSNAMSSMSGGTHAGARRLLNVEKDNRTGTIRPLVDALDGASEQRAQMITLALVLGAFEELTSDPQTWRHPSPPPQEYLFTLSKWGYTLSPIEQGVVHEGGTVSGGS